ncbi:uncharacterized protein LOC135705223 [Ochlerotatus camptorhynchus]|uniref:uncharacterized protein LOC135705223 n=1 Tax=Ochlerotatus camptorhynchus TaxID=644619 RepID=UPI0031DC3650
MPTNNRGGQPPSDDDDDFFKPTPNSTLAKIFGIAKGKTASTRNSPEIVSSATKPTASKVSDRYGASSFRYVPPQEVVETHSDGETSANKSSAEWSLVQACVVTAYKLVNNTNTTQGKLGLALLNSGSEFRILIYRTKTDAVATLNLASSSKLFLKNEYLQFRSDDESFWSVLFENPAERDRLLRTIKDVCTIEKEQQHRVPPVPASRTIPIVEEPDSDIEQSKASLISRMARVGQSILPQDKPLSTTEVSDSSDTDARFETIPRSNIPPHRRAASGGSGKIQPVSMGMQMVPSAANALTTAIAGQNMLHTATDVNFNLFMTENRMQGTEVRMNLSKLESKLDRVLDKIDCINLNSGGGSAEKSAIDKDEDILALEEKIFELKKENHALKGKLRTMEAETSFRKNDAVLRQQLTESEKCCKEFEEKVAALQEDLVANRYRSDLDLKEIERIKGEFDTKNQLIAEKAKEISLLTNQIGEAQKRETLSNEKNSLLMKQIEELQNTAKNMEELKSLQPKATSSESLDDLVKAIMNSCFQRMSEQIDDARTLKIIGNAIKQETKAALARRQTK